MKIKLPHKSGGEMVEVYMSECDDFDWERGCRYRIVHFDIQGNIFNIQVNTINDLILALREAQELAEANSATNT